MVYDLGEDICRHTLLEYIFQKDSPEHQQDSYKTGGDFYTVPMKVYRLSEGCRHWLNRGSTAQVVGGHPAGAVYDDYVEFNRESMIRQAARMGGDEPLEAFTKEQLDKINYGKYYNEPVDEYELNPTVHVGRNSIEVSDIINGQRVRRRYIDYTEAEALESFIEDITTGGI